MNPEEIALTLLWQRIIYWHGPHRSLATLADLIVMLALPGQVLANWLREL